MEILFLVRYPIFFFFIGIIYLEAPSLKWGRDEGGRWIDGGLLKPVSINLKKKGRNVWIQYGLL